MSEEMGEIDNPVLQNLNSVELEQRNIEKSMLIEDSDNHNANYLSIFRKPYPRQEWIRISDDQYISSLSQSMNTRKATHSDLVLDLVYVVLTSQLGKSFRTELDTDAFEALRDFIALFIPIWLQWYTVARFLNIFDTRDVVFVCFFVMNVISMCMVGVSVERCGSSTARGGCDEFAKAMALARGITLLAQGYVLYFNRKYIKAILIRAVPDLLVCIFWIGNSFSPSGAECGTTVNSCWNTFIALWWLAVTVDLLNFLSPIWIFMTGTALSKSESLPFNTKLIVERHELFIVTSYYFKIICLNDIVLTTFRSICR
jgi:low temperature requirement protein LtrA